MGCGYGWMGYHWGEKAGGDGGMSVRAQKERNELSGDHERR